MVVSLDRRRHMVPRYSVVIPAYNEERYLPGLLDSLDASLRRYPGGAGASEVVVADNASTDGTARLASERGCRVVRVERRSIAAARNGGGRAARGEILAFCDADTRVHPDTFSRIDEVMRSGWVVGGATGVTMERWSVGIAVTYGLIWPMVRVLRLDTGVVFLRRADFAALGGFDESRRYAEDVAFQLALRRLGRQRHQRFVRIPSVRAVASTRKFDELGDWHMLSFPLRYGARRLLRRSPEELIDRYWYSVRG